MPGRSIGPTTQPLDRPTGASHATAQPGLPVSGPADAPSRMPRLTARERTVLRLLVDGLRNQEISQALQITERTVKFHVSGLFAKLGVSSRTQVVSQALRRGLI